MKGILPTKPKVLPEQALVPPENVVAPPEHLTHRVKAKTPFRYKATAGKADGHLVAGTRVAIESKAGGVRCRVVDERGLRVTVPRGALEKL
jgi:hypothetical protein